MNEIDTRFKELRDMELDTHEVHKLLVFRFGLTPVLEYYAWRADETQKIVDDINEDTDEQV